MTRYAILAATAAAVGLVGSAVAAEPAKPAFDQTQTKAVEQIVHDYLVKHPEVIMEAVEALQAKQADAQAAAQTAAVKDNATEIFQTPKGTALGNPSGDVTITEFFDYNCTYCKHALSDMSALTKADPQVRFVLKEIPVLGPQSVEATRVSLAFRALKPNLYGAFHRKLLGSRGVADENRALAVAKDLGVDEAELRPLMKSKKIEDEIAADSKLASALQISGTPTYVIDDKLFSGAVGLDNLTAAVANVRKCGSASC
ncbi:DsbA family protein [Jiella sp. M17.18]|uniref:DsbA family protein n=1 Tax=Jiella sp. M17.18 TaxID=3234247 RepID=UPI0034DE5A45